MPSSAYSTVSPGRHIVLAVVARRKQPHQRQHLGEPPLLAADREHLQAVDAGIEHGVAGIAERVGPLGSLLGLVERAGGQRQQRLVHVGHELEHQEPAAVGQRSVLLEHLSRLVEATELAPGTRNMVPVA